MTRSSHENLYPSFIRSHKIIVISTTFWKITALATRSLYLNVLLNKSQPNWQQHIEASIHKPNYHTIQLINECEQHDNIIRLGTGELSPELLPTKQIEHSLKLLSLESREIGYSEPQGSKKLRSILCEYLKKWGIETAPENILIVSGALQRFN